MSFSPRRGLWGKPFFLKFPLLHCAWSLSRERAHTSTTQNTGADVFFCFKVFFLSTSMGTDAAPAEPCSPHHGNWRSTEHPLLFMTNTGTSFAAGRWVSSELASKCISKVLEVHCPEQIWEAVLEHKQSKVFRHYSKESLRETYKIQFFSYYFRLEMTATFTGKDR